MMRVECAVRELVLFVLLIVGEVTATAALKRTHYEDSKAGCTFSARDGDVLITMRPSPQAHHGRRTEELARRLIIEFSNTSDVPSDLEEERESVKPFHIIPALAAHLHNHTLDLLFGLDEVELVEADCGVRVTSSQSAAPWNLDRIDSCHPSSVCQAALDGTYTYGSANGAGGVVYILDTGVRISHNEFGGRAIAGFSSGCPQWSDSRCTHNGGAWPYQGVITDTVNTHYMSTSFGSTCSSHGTHCAGTAAGATYGVAKGATIVAVSALDCSGTGYTSDVIAALEWAVNDTVARGASTAVASLSLGGGYSSAQNAAIAAAHAAGRVVVVAAGNERSNACSSSPSSAPDAITVGATTSSDALALYSNNGSCVDILAPGSDVISATALSNRAIATYSGTSMATPAVAGAVVQLRQRSQLLSSTQVTAMLLCLATPNAISSVSAPTPNRLLYAGNVFSDPYDARAIACGW